MAYDAVKVTARQVIALAHEGQRLRTIEGLGALVEIGAGHLVLNVLVEADLDATDGISKQRKAQQAHLGVVVNGYAGQGVHHLQQAFAAGFYAALFDVLIRIRCLFALRLRLGVFLLELLDLVVFVRGVDGIDLHIAVVRIVDIGIARNGYRGSARAVFRNAHEHDGVGVFLALGNAGVEIRQLLFRERIALGIGSRVLAYEQDIGGAVQGRIG